MAGVVNQLPASEDHQRHLGMDSESQVFSMEGNRKKGYRCVPCIKFKKGCRGTPPVCDTCQKANRAHRCSFDDGEVAAAYAEARARNVTPGRKNTGLRASNVEIDQPAKASPFSGEATTRSMQTLMHQDGSDQTQTRKRKAPGDSADLESVATYSSSRQDVVSEELELDQTTLQGQYQPRMPPTPQLTREARTNLQKRTIHAMSSDEIAKAKNSLTRKFINEYDAPFSRSLLPILEEMVNGAIDSRTSNDGMEVYAQIKAFFRYVWRLVLSCMSDQESRKLGARQHEVPGRKLMSNKPVTEREVEEFFFAYICILYGKQADESVWAESAQEKARAWYLVFVDNNWDYLRDCLYWHECEGLGYQNKADWLSQWLRARSRASGLGG
ncbi:hypothetical protein LTR64_000906 [Lithohypha guttulata]|uniref:uncharacterized protein n=1 Tax=Lithohypha guttulata TaxID=1690604 RepID=UPI002DDE6A2B|nr:hypothetical protein LTR51_003100 [Lithohypha guttulata]